MAAVIFNPGINKLLTNSGAIHAIPSEVVDQAEEHEIHEFAARWAFKAGLIDREELTYSLAKHA
ncbi:MAG: hypothetical protein DDT34_00216 [Firmicutes bacterium]|nr:hypothetical protein [Bacillota bacterium]